MREKTLRIISMSGGLDSATMVADALTNGFDVYVLNFNYGQKNVVERKAFEYLLDFYKNKYRALGKIIGSKELDLTGLFDEFLSLWQDMRDDGKMKEVSDHTYYTPSRNLLFTVISAVVGEIIAINNNYDKVEVGLGIHLHSEEAYGEHKNYWDITSDFAKAIGKVLHLNDVVKMDVSTPFVSQEKKDIVNDAIKLGVPWVRTWTCYNPQEEDGVYHPCLECEACVERQLAGDRAGVPDINSYEIPAD